MSRKGSKTVSWKPGRTPADEAKDLATRAKQERWDHHVASGGSDPALRMKLEGTWNGARWTEPDPYSDPAGAAAEIAFKRSVGGFKQARQLEEKLTRALAVYDDREMEAEVEDLKRRALAKGWRPGCSQSQATSQPRRRDVFSDYHADSPRVQATPYRRQSVEELKRIRAGMDPNSNAYHLITAAINRQSQHERARIGAGMERR